MALENVEVLGNLQNQLNQVEEQLNALTNTRLRLLKITDRVIYFAGNHP